MLPKIEIFLGANVAIQELIISKIGEAVAKAILKLWLGESGIIGNLAGSSVDVIGTLSLDFLSKRKLEREFHQIADRVSDNLFALFELEGSKIDENDKSAIIIALGDAIDRTDTRPVTLIKNFDLKSSELSKSLLVVLETPKKTFSADSCALLDRAAAECASYVVEIATRLPTFSSSLFSELLQRQRRIDDTVVEVLGEIRKLSETTRAFNPEEEAAKFERRYRTAIAHRNDEVELFGLDAPSKIRRQNLKVAYISLSMQRRGTRKVKLERSEAAWREFLPSGVVAYPIESFMHSASRAASGVFARWRHRYLFSSESCDAVLASTHRLLVRGEAGSGKTTLLQWVAVSAASQRLEGPLASWNSLVPFMVHLRHYAEKALPSLTELVTNSTPEVADGMPDSWIEKVLASGRALVLLDGIDELDAVKREEVRVWVRSLVNGYPRCRYILTSRMAAVEDDWLASEKFEEAELLAMGWPDVDNLIDHWHNALAIQPAILESPEELRTICAQLKRQLRQNRRLADLATSPLLCAMLCALHYERRQQLPPNRIILYDAAIRMLLDQRDRARGIGRLNLPDLTEEQKRAFLERLAYWMLRNGQAASTLADATAEIARSKPYVQGLPSDATPVRVIELLRQRSGIIRSPAEGYVDFVHKTFQEFLGAKAVVDAADLAFLVTRAHEDQWHETIVLAAGLAPQKQRDKFLASLIKRGEDELPCRHKLYLLSVACLETAVKLSPEIEKLLDEHIKVVIPPRSMTEARSLKAAGSLAVPLLKKKGSYGAREAAAAVRALWMIGGSDALAVLETYAEDHRKTVIRELVDGWASFDSEEYARRILANSPLDSGALLMSKKASLKGIEHLKHLKNLDVAACDSQLLSNIAESTTVRNLRINGIADGETIEPVRRMKNLKEFEIYDAKGLSSLYPISDLTFLEQLVIFGADSVTEYFDATRLENLRRLFFLGSVETSWGAENRFGPALELCVMSPPVRDFSIFACCEMLSVLQCRAFDNAKNINGLGSLAELTDVTIDLNGVSELGWMSRLNKLTSVALRGIGDADIKSINAMSELESVELSGGAYVDVASLINGKKIHYLQLSDTVIDGAVPDVEELGNLKVLHLSNVRGLSDISSLEKYAKNIAVSIVNCPDIEISERQRNAFKGGWQF